MLPISKKISERLIYYKIYHCLTDNNLISKNQSGFKQRDSCINQIVTTTHQNHNSQDNCFVVHSVFLDISKAFD